jgi:CRISPR-associated protein Csx3
MSRSGILSVGMPEHFRVEVRDEVDGVVTIHVGFEIPAANTELVPAAIEALSALNLTGGRGIRFNGPASLPVAMALAHAVGHLFGYVACYDPKLSGYVVAISHDPKIHPGQLLT